MTLSGPKSIRAKVTIMAAVATACAMALIVAAMGFGARAILEQTITDSLQEHVDRACELVKAGKYEEATDAAGNVVIQIIDKNGKVVAGSYNARGLAAITTPDAAAKSEVDGLEFSLEEPDRSEQESVYGPYAGYIPDTSTVSEAQNEESVTPIQTDNYGDGADGGDSSDDADDDADDNDGDDDDNDDPDDDDDDDPDDDGDEGADDDDDDDDRKSLKRVKTQAKQSGNSASSVTSKQAISASLPWNSVAWADESNSDGTTIDARSVLGVEGPYLILKEQVDSPDGQMTVVGVTSLASAVESAKQLAWLLGAIMLAVLVAVVAFAWMLTGRTLRPVEEMRAQAAAITAEDLGKRIDVPESDKDLARLAVTLNEMLSRIERSLEEEKRFVSDASHELKSPIAASTIIIDTLRAYPDDLDLPTALDDLARENARMAAIVNDMLALTRYDEDRLICHPEPLDLMDFILERTLELSARANCTIDTTDVRPVVCRADEKLLGHALRNLLDNAARYATSTVKVSCEENDGTVAIIVSDDGCGIAPEDRVRVFGRFTCLDDERSGTGLGLAVAETAIIAHGGTVAFVDPELGGATARIELPSR